MTLIFCFLAGFSFFAQTLVINEVSNGPAGNQEYIEFIVVDDAVSYDCNSGAPPCVDIRGWIIDDNSGYHGAGGVASGCNRFSFNSFWQCIPLGTIILVYNNAEPNTNLPVIDSIMTDNNCRLVIPINNPQLFQSNPNTPGAISCSYPTTGWVNGGDWSTITLANSGDCARLVNLAGCEVSSVCWAGVNQNTQIYFNSGNSGTDNVWYFNGENPSVQANWSEGCADNETTLDAGSCGIDNQTPGAANNALNSAYIAQFNNNCQPIQPLALSLVGTTSQSCSCDGSASISASGSIGPYTYAWFDNFNVPLGQNSASATNLCSGNYYCVVTSSIDCKDTIPVFVGSICSNFGTFASATMIQNCVNNQFYNTTWASLPDQINPNEVLFNSYDYGPFFQNSNTLILRGGEVKTYKNPGANVCGAKLYYTVYTVGNQPANPLFTILDLPFKESCAVGPNNFPTGGPCFNATDQKWAKENYNIDLTTYPPGDYVIEVYYAVPGSYTSTTGCNDTIYVNNNGSNYKALFQIKPQPLISGGPLTICPGNTSTLTSNFTTGNTWSNASANQSITVNTSGTYTLTVNLNNNCPNLSDNETVNVYAAPTVDAGANQTTCGGAGAISLNGVIGGSATGVLWSSPSGSISSTNSASTTYTPSITSGVVTIILTATGPCPSVQDQLILLVNATPTVNSGADQTICAGSNVNLSGAFGGSANSILWTAPSGSFSNTTSTTSSYAPSITSGSVTLTLTASGPCPSVSDQVTINVNAPTTPTFTQISPICSGGTISLPTTSLNGITGTWSPATNNSATTLYTFTPSTGQCASTTTMTVDVNATPTINAGNNTSICVGNTVNLSGIIGGSATSATWSAPSGTFSDATNLTTTYTTSITSGSITLTLTANGPCPAVTDQVTISIITPTIPTFNSQGPYCSGDPFTLHSQSINGVFGTWSPAINNNLTTNYTFTPNSGQCANSTTLSITINPIVTPTFTQITPICSGGSISLSTTSLNGISGIWSPTSNNTATTLYTFTPTAGQCASIATMTVTVNSPTLPTFNQVAPICSGGSFVLPSTSSNGISGTWSPAINNTVTTNYTFIPTAGQCATNATMTIAVNPIFSTNTAQTVCPSQIPYVWNGVTFNAPGTQTATLSSVNNCDSLVTMTLNVSSTITSNTSLSICPGDLPYSWNGLTFNSAGSQSVNLTATSGCDSVATLNLAVFNTQSSTISLTLCQSQIPYSWNGLTFNGSGTQTATLQDVNGCDSLATLTIQVANTLSSSSAISVCPSELPYSWNGLTFSNAGTQTATLQSIGGCDSLATLTLSLNTTYNETETISICSNESPYLWNGLSFSSSSNQTITLNSINGCDSIVTLNLNVLPFFTTTLDSTICENEIPLIWNGLTFNAAGTQTLTSSSANGCDSLIIMNVQVLSIPQISISGGGVFCEGDVIQPVEVNVVGSSPFNVSYTLDGVGFNISSNQTIISLGNIAGDYVLTEISDQNCRVNSNLSSAAIIINPIPSAPQVGNDSIYCLNSTPDSLIASGNLNSSITWFIDPALSNPIQTGNSYYPDINLGQTTYYVVQEINGCVSAPNEVMITFEICDIIVPTAFTPDGDNTNDFWNLGNIDALYPNNLVTIYNRWGNLIYQSQPGKYQSKPWDGTHNQEPMPVGSYYFIIEFGETFKGNESGIVTIVK